MADSSSLGLAYEALLRGAHGKQTSKNGAYASIMSDLIKKEAGKTNVSQEPGTARQLEKVKEYIVMALDKYLKKKMSQSLRDSLEQLKKQTLAAKSSSELVEICELALAIVTN